MIVNICSEKAVQCSVQFLLFHVISLVVARGKEGHIKYIPGKLEKALSRASNICGKPHI